MVGTCVLQNLVSCKKMRRALSASSCTKKGGEEDAKHPEKHDWSTCIFRLT